MAECIYCMKTLRDGAQFCPHCGKDQTARPQQHHLPPGTMLRGRYRVGAALGEGGFGVTYVGLDTALDLRVAIKEFFPAGFVTRMGTVSASVSALGDGEKSAFFQKGKERFLQEARVLARFSGARGIVDVRDFFEENNTAYIVMEFLDGVTLKQYLKQNGTLSPEKTVALLMPVMKSLHLLHKENVIHRDVSPDNIMLVGEEVKLLDFGAARSVGGDQKSLSVMLKPGYAPEEQYRSKGKQGPWTDVYALSATMYRCMTGVRPEEGPDRIWDDGLQAPSALGVAISPQTEAALLKGLAVKAEDRWQSVDALLNALTADMPAQPAAVSPAASPAVSPAAGPAAVAPTGATAASLVKRAFLFLEDGEWQSADEYAEKVLDMDPENGEAYLAKLLSRNAIHTVAELRELRRDFRKDPNYLKFLRFSPEPRREEIRAIVEQNGVYVEEKIIKVQEEQYASLLRQKNEASAADTLQSLAASFEALGGYKDSAKQAADCRSRAEWIRTNVGTVTVRFTNSIREEGFRVKIDGRNYFVDKPHAGRQITLQIPAGEHRFCVGTLSGFTTTPFPFTVARNQTVSFRVRSTFFSYDIQQIG